MTLTQAEIDAFFERYKLVEVFKDGEGDSFALIMDTKNPYDKIDLKGTDWDRLLPTNLIVAFIDDIGENKAVIRTNQPKERGRYWKDLEEWQANLFVLMAFPFLTPHTS